MYEFIRTESHDDVELVLLDRPDKLNALSVPMRRELVSAIGRAGADAGVRAVVLSGAGERAFCAGQDLEETQGFDADNTEGWVAETRALYDAIRRFEKPLVAAVNGVAVGAGFQTALLCDLRIGHPGVRMGQPEINAGLPSTLGPWVMWPTLGAAKTVELTLTGRMVEAEECLQLGLLNEAVPAEQVLDRAFEIARQLAAKPPVAMSLTKRRFRELTQDSFEDALAAGVRLQREAFATGEPQQTMRAFFEKRRRGKS